jgi:hypothetical protein
MSALRRYSLILSIKYAFENGPDVLQNASEFSWTEKYLYNVCREVAGQRLENGEVVR